MVMVGHVLSTLFGILSQGWSCSQCCSGVQKHQDLQYSGDGKCLGTKSEINILSVGKKVSNHKGFGQKEKRPERPKLEFIQAF